jgi:methyltransferase (TIGR00027 family)
MARPVSRTAQGVAVVRAGFRDRPHTPHGDPDAQRRLTEGMRAGRAPLLRDHLLARTRFFDACVLEAIERGVEQVVVVGAGYDDRALRFRSPGVRFFELDHPATQEDKRRRVEALGTAAGDGLVFVPADFARESVGTALADAGHDGRRPTLFVCEGLVIYLEADEIVELLRALGGRAAAGSELAISMAVHADELQSAAVVRAANTRRLSSGRREPWRTILPAAEHLELLHRAGWRERRAIDDSVGSLLVRAEIQSRA